MPPDDAAESLASAAEHQPRPVGLDAAPGPLILGSSALCAGPLAGVCRQVGELRAVAAHELAAVLAARRPGRVCLVVVDDALADAAGLVATHLQAAGPVRVVALVEETAAQALEQRLGDSLAAALPKGAGPVALALALRTAARDAAADDRVLFLESERRRLAGEITKLNRIGIALSTERDQERLLSFILTTARDFTCSDAGSLYIVERDAEGQRRLRFNNSQNDSLPHLELVKFTIPVSKSTLAGYVAVTGEP
ncbi:MAG TPA: hypothetical protein VIK91_14740, partial [Nannocystis sp.]